MTDERSLMRDALKHTMGEARLLEIRAEFARRVEVSELIEVSHREGAAGRTFTTREMQGNERELIERMKLSQGNREVLADGNVRQRTMEQHPHLSLSQRNAVDTVLTSRDQMMALEGVAGAGKTTSLAAVRGGCCERGLRGRGACADIAGCTETRRGGDGGRTRCSIISRVVTGPTTAKSGSM